MFVGLCVLGLCNENIDNYTSLICVRRKVRFTITIVLGSYISYDGTIRISF